MGPVISAWNSARAAAASRFMKSWFCLYLSAFVALIFPRYSFATDPPPVLTNLSVSGSQFNVNFTPFPAAQAYTLLTTSNLSLPFLPNTNYYWAAYNVMTNYVTNGAIIT